MMKNKIDIISLLSNQMTYVDTPDKKQKHPHYEHRTTKLDLKDNEFTSKKFQQVRKTSTHKDLLKSFGRIGMCLNEKSPSVIPTEDLRRVCLILIKDTDEVDKELGVGPLNDGYLIGLKHHRLGFKIMYLYNSGRLATFLDFFMKNTTEALTVFYSGRDHESNSITFKDGVLQKSTITDVISKNSNPQLRVMFITDSLSGGSFFNINGSSNMISFWVRKTSDSDSKDAERTHGIFTYYFCKIIGDCPNISPNRLIERMNPSLTRFDEEFQCEMSNKDLGECPIFK